MEIIEVEHEEYDKVISEPYHIFETGSFANLNRDKAEKIYYLVFKDSKIRLGLVGGIRNNIFLSPFSAPFGGFSFINHDIKIRQIDEALTAFIEWTKKKELDSIKIVLPPTIYEESFISKQSNAFFRKGFNINSLDLNYSFKTKFFTENYKDLLWRNARKNLNNALENNLNFHLCETSNENKKAYQIIKKNRESKGFPLRMTWEQVEATAKNIPADFFICEDSSHNSIASAIVFNVAKNCVQVIYWGDDLEFSQLKTMNYLSFNIFKYYKEQNISIIDIGPSTENSIPNYGLCEFKESIGCDISQKLTFELKL